MAYIHIGKRPVLLRKDPIDPDSEDWFYFSYGGRLLVGADAAINVWLESGETISAHSEVITGGTVSVSSTLVGTTVDNDGITYYNVYGVKAKPTAGVTEMILTHRKSTTTGGSPDFGRTDIDHTMIIPVVSQ